MSDYKDLKREFIQTLACSGTAQWDRNLYGKLAQDNPQVGKLFDKWVEKFYKHKEIVFNPAPRVVNHFKLGADPEFVFMQDGQMVDAVTLGLKAGLAVGADNNGRLAELRPAPSKSALKVVASLYAEFCFLAQWNPAYTRLKWMAVPFAGKDGLGGHIHFSRWQQPREQEIFALDNLMRLMTDANCISFAHQKARLGTGLYGKFGDIRVQMHGYEYRAFPTWVGCPKQSHLYLTLAKLVVHNPKLITDYRTVKSNPLYHATQLMENILAYYQGLDDDANIAMKYFKSCLAPPAGDIQAAWFIKPVFEDVGNNDLDILPPIIHATEAHMKALFDYLTGVTKTLEQPKNVFKPLRFPEGCTPFQKVLSTERRPDLGETVWDMAMIPSELPFHNVNGHAANDRSIMLSEAFYELIMRKLGSKRPTINGQAIPFRMLNHETKNYSISLPVWMLNKQNRKETREFLTESGIFPFVRMGQPLIGPDYWKIQTEEKILLRA